MNDYPLHYETITALYLRIRSGELSPVALTASLLARIEALNGPLNAFNLVTEKRALAEARAAETLIQSGRWMGPLHGIPYGVKDIFDVAGLPTSAGSRTLGENIAGTDSTVTHKLAQAGMIVLGKTITVEFAKGILGINHIQGTPHNPWHREAHVPGGSSAGSAVAVASGMAPMALGSDTGGSVRAPAGLCGTVGLKTTVGRISRHGVFPMSWTLDSVGPLTRSVEDAALVYQALQGEDPQDETTAGVGLHDALGSLKSGVRGMRIGIPEELFFDELHPEVDAALNACGDVFRKLGAQVDGIPFPEAAQVGAMGLISNVEACVIHEERLRSRLEEMDPVVGMRMLSDLDRPAIEYVKALRGMKALRASARGNLRDVDVLLVPVTPDPACTVAEADASPEAYERLAQRFVRNCRVGNLLDLCGLALPCGFTKDGLPIGLMIYGKPFAEATVLRAGYAYEQAAGWNSRRPDLSWAV
ncbi:MAG: amidase [SAR324 cluster bacterium]|nr:amidase [SAR324 cluster bacterium]